MNGNTFYDFTLGDIAGIVLDCGEDKTDDHAEYGHTVACHGFRLRETRWLEKRSTAASARERRTAS